MLEAGSDVGGLSAVRPEPLFVAVALSDGGETGSGLGDIKDLWTVKTGNVTNPAASGTQKSIGKAISLLRSHSITSLHSLQSTPSVLSRLRKALEPLLVPSQKARFSALWAHLG